MLGFREIDCPCCGSPTAALFIEGRKLDTFRFYARIDGFERLNHVRCLRCGLIYSNPRLAYTESTLEQVSPGHVARRLERQEAIQERLRLGKAKKSGWQTPRPTRVLLDKDRTANNTSVCI